MKSHFMYVHLLVSSVFLLFANVLLLDAGAPFANSSLRSATRSHASLTRSLDGFAHMRSIELGVVVCDYNFFSYFLCNCVHLPTHL
jgi:hypothetical protein